MPRVGLEQGVVLVSETANVFRQLPIVKPELRGRKVLHNSVQRPASKSLSARLPAAANLPALMSASMR